MTECQCSICDAKRRGLNMMEWYYQNKPLELEIASRFPHWQHWQIEDRAAELRRERDSIGVPYIT